MGIQHFANHFYNQTTFYVGKVLFNYLILGGAPQSIIDKFDFLQEMHPAVKRKGKIRGFVGCAEGIKVMDSPIRMTNVTRLQNIDYCLLDNF